MTTHNVLRGPRYDYTPDGKLARRTWARGVVTDYTYDNAGQLVSTTYSDTTPTITMSYDRVGNLIEVSDTDDYNWYRLYGSNGKGGCTYNNIPVRTPTGEIVYRGGFNLHTGRVSDGCVTVWSDVSQGDKGYPHELTGTVPIGGAPFHELNFLVNAEF